MFLHYRHYTKPKRNVDELKQRLIDTWDRIPQGIIDEATDHWQTQLRVCVKVKESHFEHLLTDQATLPAIFEATSDPPKPALSEPLILLRGRQRNFSVFV